MSRAVMPAEHAILGLLALGDGASHGYDLARHFADGQPLGEVIRLEPGMLYHHLKKLTRAGWLRASVQQQGSRPARHVYEITDAGRVELRRWLGEPVARTREIRLEFLVKLYFARRLDPDLVARLVADQLDVFRRLEASLAAQLAAAPGHDDDGAFTRLVLQLRQAQTGAALGWLERVAKQVEAIR